MRKPLWLSRSINRQTRCPSKLEEAGERVANVLLQTSGIKT